MKDNEHEMEIRSQDYSRTAYIHTASSPLSTTLSASIRERFEEICWKREISSTKEQEEKPLCEEKQEKMPYRVFSSRLWFHIYTPSLSLTYIHRRKSTPGGAEGIHNSDFTEEVNKKRRREQKTSSFSQLFSLFLTRHCHSSTATAAAAADPQQLDKSCVIWGISLYFFFFWF